MKAIDTLANSTLMQRLIQAPEANVRALASSVETTAKSAADVLSNVVVYMPLFTLHNERHVLNVIGWIESLLGSEGIAVLSPLECALCILAAYTHDLGMTLSSSESADLPDSQDYLRFLDRFLEERQLSQTQAAKLLGVDQPKVSQIYRGRLDDFSLERLMRFLTALHRDIRIVIDDKPRRGRGRVIVEAA